MSFLDAHKKWFEAEEALLTSTKERFPVGSVHLYSNDENRHTLRNETIFLVIDEPHIRHQPFALTDISMLSTQVIVPILTLDEAKRSAFSATSFMDRLSKRLA